MIEFNGSGNDEQGPLKKARRRRYGGTHPKRYEEKYKELDLDAYPEMMAHLLAKGKTPAGTHIPIMVEEVMECLKPETGEVVVDCTLGYGGHAAEFIKHIGSEGKLIGLDVDKVQLERTKNRLSKENVHKSFYHSNFAGIAKVLKKENLAGCDIIFADLGVSSMQIDDPSRGMSYKNEGPLDMRMDERLKQTGGDMLNKLSEEKLSNAFWELADETSHKEIARLIVEKRSETLFKTTSQLVDVIFQAKHIDRTKWQKDKRISKSGLLHPAARTFQALRILVNDELGSLKELLRIAPYCLRPGGRIGIISFHSGEDRLVKKSFRENVRNGVYQEASKEPIRPQRKEIVSNPRSKSAKFRWAIQSIE